MKLIIACLAMLTSAFVWADQVKLNSVRPCGYDTTDIQTPVLVDGHAEYASHPGTKVVLGESIAASETYHSVFQLLTAVKARYCAASFAPTGEVDAYSPGWMDAAPYGFAGLDSNVSQNLQVKLQQPARLSHQCLLVYFDPNASGNLVILKCDKD